MSINPGLFGPAELERRVAARMARQQILTKDDPPATALHPGRDDPAAASRRPDHHARPDAQRALSREESAELIAEAMKGYD